MQGNNLFRQSVRRLWIHRLDPRAKLGPVAAGFLNLPSLHRDWIPGRRVSPGMSPSGLHSRSCRLTGDLLLRIS